MYKFFYLIFPVFLLGASGKLVHVVDGDTLVFEKAKKRVVCQVAYIDALEDRLNKKLKKEIKECSFTKNEFLRLGKLSTKFVKSNLKIGTTYSYDIVGKTRSGNNVCKIKLPKALHVEINPYLEKLMISKGYALPFIINADEKTKEALLKRAKDAKKQNLGLWRENKELMQCLVEHRYSLRSLR